MFVNNMGMGGMGGYAFGQQAYRPAPGALNWNPGYGAGPFMPREVMSGPRAFQSGQSNPYLQFQPAPVYASGDFTNAIASGSRQDEEDRNRSAARVNNIRNLQRLFMQALTNAGMRERGLDLQELRLMDQ